MIASVAWAALFRPDVPALEIFVRGTAMYLGILLLLRVAPAREIGTLSHTNLLVLVLLADAAQNGMAGDYHSIVDGLLLVATLIFWSVIIDIASYRSPRVRRLVQPPPLRLIRHGRVVPRALRSEFISHAELATMLREHGIHQVEQVQEAWLEPDGQFSVVVRPGPPRTP